MTALQDWNEDFPVWPALNIARFVPGLSEAGVDLLEVITHPDYSSSVSADHSPAPFVPSNSWPSIPGAAFPRRMPWPTPISKTRSEQHPPVSRKTKKMCMYSLYRLRSA